MNLVVPPEPQHLKEEVLAFLRKYPEARDEGGHSVADPISYWYGNKLPRYFWKSGWGPDLKQVGFDEDRFMRTVGAHRVGFFRWIDEEMAWDRLADLIVRSVEKTAEALRQAAV